MSETIVFLNQDRQLCQLLKTFLEGQGYAVTIEQKDEARSALSLAEDTGVYMLRAVATGAAKGSSPASGNVVTGPSSASGNVGTVPAQAPGNIATGSSPAPENVGAAPTITTPSTPAEQSVSAAHKMRDFQSMFMALKLKYARGLPEKLAEIVKAYEDAQAKDNDESRKTLRDLAHKIVGTAGSYGYAKLAGAMKAIEETVLSRPKSGPERKKQWQFVGEQIEIAKAAEKTIAEETADTLSQADTTASAPKPAPSFGQPSARVLLVDDDDTFLGAVEAIGRQCALDIVKAGSAADALAQACLEPLDAALITIAAADPERSYRLALDLRSLPGNDSLPLAFIRTSEVTDSPGAAHAGGSLFLDKPLTTADLDKAVHHLVAIRQGGRPRVLIVDDDESFAASVGLTLRHENSIVKIVTDPSTVLEVMQQFPPDLLLLDVNMPQITGFEVCKQVRAVPRWQDLPIIFLTAATGVEARVEAFKSGGDDYLPKPVVNEELLARVKVRLDKSRMLKERSDRDTITGLFLRRAFMEQLQAVVAESERQKTTFAVCLLDVDHFKKVNDTYGHLAGDRVLAGLGQLLQRRFRVDDLRGRWGGEEFILAFKRESGDAIIPAINRVLEEFKDLKFTGDKGQEFHVSFSGGMASFPDSGKTLPELLAAADRRLYHAKESGRARIVGNEMGDND
jgi:diguanylate cyclase (GGDEF)-like protein